MKTFDFWDKHNNNKKTCIYTGIYTCIKCHRVTGFAQISSTTQENDIQLPYIAPIDNMFENHLKKCFSMQSNNTSSRTIYKRYKLNR